MDVEEKGDIKITRVHIQEEEGQRIMGKPKGNYITRDSKIRKGEEFKEEVAKFLSVELSKIAGDESRRMGQP